MVCLSRAVRDYRNNEIFCKQVDQPGTYWYHSHTQSQYPDGLRGPLIIYDDASPFKGEYEEELILPLSDWYHDQMSALLPTYMTKGNMMLQEPLPQSNLINETQNLKIGVQPGKTYLVRVINMGAFMGQYFWMEGHNMTIVELDGVYTKPTVAGTIYLATGQRCSFLLKTKDDRAANYPIVASLDPVRFTPLFTQRLSLTGICRTREWAMDISACQRQGGLYMTRAYHTRNQSSCPGMTV